jgi:multiple antibiotic resistance protein
MEFVHKLMLAFIPMFVAVDIAGCLPFFIGATQEMNQRTRDKVIKQSVLTALCIAITFVFVGDALFNFLTIEIYDFMIAGGAVLFLLSSRDLLSVEKEKIEPNVTFGVVPLGTPLLSGPAVLATAIIIIKQFGVVAAIFAIVSNLLIAGIAFHYSHLLIKILGKNGSKAFSKIMALVLAAYGVMMMRQGFIAIIKAY